MEDAQARECRTREAESLEQAKQTNHEDLRHLHETIAQQWHRLAEVIETGRAFTQPLIATAPDIPVPEATTDATSDIPTALPIEPLDGADNGAAHVSSGAEEIERRDQVCENDHGGGEDSLDAEDSEILDQQTVGSASQRRAN